MTQISTHTPTAEHAEQGAVYGGAQHVSVTTSFSLRLLAVAVNILVLAELCVAMYYGSQDMDNITPIFFKVFFSLLIPTIVGTIILRRILSARMLKTTNK